MNKKMKFNVVTKKYRVYYHNNDKDYDGIEFVEAESEEAAKLKINKLFMFRSYTIESIEEVKEND